MSYHYDVSQPGRLYLHGAPHSPLLQAASAAGRLCVTVVLEAMIARYYPGRAPGRDYDPMPNAHLEATVFVAMQIEDASAKVRRGGPKGPRDADPHASSTAGVLDFPRLELPFQR